MKRQIDELLLAIQQALATPAPRDPQIETLFRAIGIDGYSRAVALRDRLLTWSEDASLPMEMRDYLLGKLDGMPSF